MVIIYLIFRLTMNSEKLRIVFARFICFSRPFLEFGNILDPAAHLAGLFADPVVQIDPAVDSSAAAVDPLVVLADLLGHLDSIDSD